MFCKKCGTKMPGTGYCPSCGTMNTEIKQDFNFDSTPQQPPRQEPVIDRVYQQPKMGSFCPTCGTPITGGLAFCPSCGTKIGMAPMAPKKGGSKKKLWITGGSILAGVVVVALGVTIFVNALEAKPINALLLGTQNFSQSMENVESFTATLTTDGTDIELSAEIDKKDKEFSAAITSDLFNGGEIYACYADGKGGYCIELDGEVECESFDQEMLDGIDQVFDELNEERDLEDIDWEQLFEDAGILDDVEEYIEIDQINDTVKDVIGDLTSSKTNKELTEALNIKKSKDSGETTYKTKLTTSGVVDGADILLDLAEDDCGDLFKDEDDFQYVIDSAKSELKSMDDDESISLGTFSWSVKHKYLTGIKFKASEDLAEEMDTEMTVTLNIDYDGKEVNKIDFDMETGSSYTSMSMTIKKINDTEVDMDDSIREQILNSEVSDDSDFGIF